MTEILSNTSRRAFLLGAGAALAVPQTPVARAVAVEHPSNGGPWAAVTVAPMRGMTIMFESPPCMHYAIRGRAA